jgi:hypothetical protein
MTTEKKDKSAESSAKHEKVVCNPHNFTVVGWNTKGGIQNATNMRCSHCLMHVSLEQLESKEWKESQGF